MAPPKDIARSYPKRGLTADVGFRSEPKFCGDGSAEYVGTNGLQFDGDHTFVNGFSVAGWYWIDGTQSFNYAGFAGTTLAWGFPSSGTYLVFYQKATSTAHQTVGGTLTPKQWNHIAFTLSQDGLTVKAYLNGVELTITQPSVAIVLPSLTNIAEAGIASFQNASPGAGLTLPYGGQMANQIWYDGVLTQDEVRQLMRAPNYAVASTIVTPQFYFELFSGITDSTGNATTVEDRGTTTTAYGVKRPQLPRGLDLARGAAMARVYTGRAVDFDGSTDHMEAAVYSNSSDYYSVSVWVNPDAIGANRNIVASGDTGDNAFLIFVLSTGAVYFYGNDTTGDYAIIHQTTLTAGRWYHLAMAVDQSDAANNTIKAYIDGVENTTSKSAQGWVGNSTALEIAARNSTTLFDGTIAGVKIFNSELTAAQVRELYHNPEQVLPTGVSAGNLRRYYPLSDYNDTGGTGGRYFQDMGADGEPAEDQGSASMAFAQPVPCPQLGLQQSATRLYYDGTSGTTYNVEVTGHSLNLPSFSIAFWGFFQSNNPNTTSCCFDTSGGGTFQYFINSTAGNLTVYNGAPTATFNGAVPRDEWVHVVITGHDSSPYIKCYVNGAEKTINSGSAATVGLVATNYYLFSRSANTLSHTGFGDNYSIYDSNLGASEALELYNQGIGYDPRTNVGNYTSASSLIRLYKFDDLTTVKDYSGNNAHADVNGTFKAASFPENASGSTIVGDFSMKRKGVSVLNLGAVSNAANEYALSAKDSAFLPSFANGGAFSCFFRLQKLGEFSSIFINDDYGSGTQHRFAVYLNSANKVYFELGDGVSARANPNTTGTISDSDWHHFAFTVDYGGGSTTTIKLFLDGVLDSTSTATTLAGVPNATALRFGDYVTSGANEANGPIACPKFYQVTLSDNEIEQIYRSDLRLIKGLANE